uniref:MADS-box domain-containing protein n=1 Tax=Hordeum vulgare subsp. vulgare TaxID=112509 RepID=A0A8I6X5Q8_HORVV
MPRGLGWKGMGRGGAQTRPIAAIPITVGGDRRVALEVRKAGLAHKAKELAEMAEAPVAVLCSGLDGQGVVQCWPSTETARAVVGQFLKLPKEARFVFDQANYVEGVRDVQGSRLARVREGGLAAALELWESPLDGMPEDALRELLASIGRSLDAARSRIRRLQQTQRRESVAENFVVAGEAQGTRRQPRGAVTDHDAARKKQLVASEGHGSGEVQGTRRQPRGAATAHDAARKKRLVKDIPKVKPADADGAAWRKQLVEDFKEKPVPAAPFDPGMTIEHINVGGYVMERGAYDFIQHDLGMLPPSLEPEPPEPGYDDPLRLWSWDDSSFPQSAPPPK